MFVYASVGVTRTLDSFLIMSSLLHNTQVSNTKLIDRITDQVVNPLHQFFQDDVKQLKDSRRNYEKTLDKYESMLNRYHSLSKIKDDFEDDMQQLREERYKFIQASMDHFARINSFKRKIDLFFEERIVLLLDELSEFFASLAENFGAVKAQKDKVRGEMDKLKRGAQLDLIEDENQRILLLQQAKYRIDEFIFTSAAYTAGKGKEGQLMMRKKKSSLTTTAWRRIYAKIIDGAFSYESLGRQRVKLGGNYGIGKTF